ncbi:MAG: hypothetical protein PHI12_15160 [Dehalococcoidales bacterium]|nr:hypothetical protein [Dehalococcoidales bacterium]
MTKTKKQRKSKLHNKKLPWYLWLAIALGITGAVVGIRACHFNSPEGSAPSGELKAAIIDQLYVLEPNQDFIQQATNYLEEYGFEVDVYHGEEVTVDLYRKLPTYGYRLIIFRAHSGMLGGEGSPDEGEIGPTFLFTGETYKITELVWEQIGDQILPAQMTEDYPMVFAVSSSFIIKSMEGKFQDTAIIMMGCSSAYQGDMAEAFIHKGASVYMGWSASIGLGYVDQATLELINNLCAEDMSVAEALTEMVDEVGLDPDYHAHPQYHPDKAGDKTIAELIR